MVSVLSQFVAAAGMPPSIVLAWAAALLVMLVLCAWLVPHAGAAGAAFSLSATYLVLLLMVLVVAFAHRGVSA